MWKELVRNRGSMGALGAATLIVAGCGAEAEPKKDEDHVHGDGKAERLLITDASASSVSVFDVNDEKVVGTISVASIGNIYMGPSGRYAYVVQGANDLVEIIDSGMSIDDHGDHAHYERNDPTLLSTRLPGNNPIHFVSHDPHIAIFYDDDGDGLIYDETKLGTSAFTPIRTSSGLPHHGVAVPWGDVVLTSHAEIPEGATRASPIGIQVFNRTTGLKEGDPILGCPSLHGEAGNEEYVAFGCRDGVLLVGGRSGAITSKKIENPAGTPTNTRVGTVKGQHDVPFFIGNFGSDRLVRIDPAGAGSLTPIALPEPLATAGYLQFELSEDGSALFVLGKNGQLYRLNPANGEQLGAALTVTTTPTDDSGHGAKYPQMSFGHDLAYITNPQAQKVAAVDLETFELKKEFTVPGAPTKIAVARFQSHDH